MYPLIFILPVAVYRKDKHIPFYVLPLTLIGTLFAGYHSLLYYGFLPESTISCAYGISCTSTYVEWFGFITIPLLSLLAFLVISAAMVTFFTDRKGE